MTHAGDTGLFDDLKDGYSLRSVMLFIMRLLPSGHEEKKRKRIFFSSKRFFDFSALWSSLRCRPSH
jgi:hypothetical protein